MIDSKANKQPQPKIVVGPKSSSPKSSTGNVAIMPDTVPSQDRIRVRAYELYRQFGDPPRWVQPGQDERDWLRAEREILKRER